MRDPLEPFRRMLDPRGWPVEPGRFKIDDDGEVIDDPEGNRVHPMYRQSPEPTFDLDIPASKIRDLRKYRVNAGRVQRP